MALDRESVIQAATRFAQKGQYERAAKALEENLKQFGKDPDFLRRIAEWQLRANQNRSALEYLRKAAELYRQQGFATKAVAVVRQALNVDETLTEFIELLADLLQQNGQMNEAAAALEKLVGIYTQRREGYKVIETMRLIADLDRNNLINRVRLADVYAREGMVDSAVAELTELLSLLKEQNQVEEYLQCAERVLALRPDELELLLELASIRAAKGDRDGSFERLQRAFQQAPHDARVLAALAQHFADAGERPRAYQVYRELARVRTEAGDRQGARTAWRHALDMEPDSQEARQALDELDGAVQRSRTRPLTAAPQEGVGQFERMLTEAGVYVRYGLRDQATRMLRAVLSEEPGNAKAIELTEKLGLDVNALFDDALEAAAEEAAQHAGESAARGRTAEVAAGGVEGEASDESDDLDLEIDIDLDLDGDGDVDDADQKIAARLMEGGPAIDAANPRRARHLVLVRAAEASAEQIASELAAASRAKAVAEPSRVRTSVPEMRAAPISQDGLRFPELYVPGDDDGAVMLGEDVASGMSGMDDDAAVVLPEVGDAAGAGDAGEAVDVSERLPTVADGDVIRSAYDEAEFYAQQGLIDEAVAVYETLLRAYPGHVETRARIDWLRSGEQRPLTEQLDKSFDDVLQPRAAGGGRGSRP